MLKEKLKPLKSQKEKIAQYSAHQDVESFV